VFSFVMQDASGSIRVTCWKSAAVALVNLFSTADLIQLSGPMQVKVRGVARRRSCSERAHD